MTPQHHQESMRERNRWLDDAAGAGVRAVAVARAVRRGGRARRAVGSVLVSTGSRLILSASQPCISEPEGLFDARRI